MEHLMAVSRKAASSPKTARKSARISAPKSAKKKTGAKSVKKATKTAAKKKSAKKAPTKAAKRKTAAKRPAKSAKRWSQDVTEHSDALDLKQGVFTLTDAKKIAASLKKSAEHSSRRKTGTYRSALSMLTFYINRAGKTLPKTQAARLERAKDELKKLFGRDD
jgi:hypothetical protein